MKLQMNRLFIALFTIIILNLGGGLAYADINSGLVAHWPLDGNANDAVGGNNGTEYGDITYVGGVLGQAASFNGFSDYISAPHSTSLTINGPITISSWIKTPGNPNYESWLGIVNKKAIYFYFRGSLPPPPEARYDGYTAAISNACQYYSSLNDVHPIQYTYNASETYLTDGRWHHILSAYDGVMLKIYVDGKPDVSKIGVITGLVNRDEFTSYDEDVTPYPWGSFSDPSGFYSGMRDAPLLIGMEPNDSFPKENYFKGLIDEVRIYNRALSDFEIEELYSQAVFDSDNDGIPDDIDICPFDPDNDVDGDGVCATPENNFKFEGTFDFTLSGTKPAGCTETGTITIGNDFNQQNYSTYYYYIPLSETSANYSFIEQINSVHYYPQYHRIARIILIIGNTLQIEENGECPNVASPCWTDDFIINFDDDYNAGNITGERYQEDTLQEDPFRENPFLCQGIMTGSFTRQGVVDNGGINNDSGNGGGGG